MVIATENLQRVPGFTRLRNHVTYLSSCCSAVATLVQKPAHVDTLFPTKVSMLDTYCADDPFSVFKDFSFNDNDGSSRRNNDGNNKSKIDEGNGSLEGESDSDSPNDLLARAQHWPVSSTSALTNSQSDSFSSPTASWARNSDFTNFAYSGTLGGSIYRPDNDNNLQTQWASAPPTPTTQQYQQSLNNGQQQPQEDIQGSWPSPPKQALQSQEIQRQLWQSSMQPQLQWSSEMGMDFGMTKDGISIGAGAWPN